MADQPQRTRPDEPAPPAAEDAPGPPAPKDDTNDASWDQLGATRVMAGNEETPIPGTVPGPAAGTLRKKTVLGEYQLLKKLGEGAMGAVYLARQKGQERDVALKVLFPHVANVPKLVERLYREGRVMGQLDHPNIVQAYAIGEDRGCHFVAMEYVDGQSMQKWLNQVGRLSVPDALRLLIDCARALSYAHGLGIIHRDIKPDNILVTKAGQVKVADLGMVKTGDEDLSLTQTGHAVGTPWYMPLEQAKNAKDVDARSDIYALGCTLYCFLTGQPPFAAKTIVEVIQAKEQGTFPPARQSNPDVPERLDLILAKMAAKLPKYRYQTCAEMIKDLEALGLAGDRLTFLDGPPPARPGPVLKPSSSTEVLIGASVSLSAPPDPDVWYVMVKKRDGQATPRQFRTDQLRKMLTDGTIAPTAKASHDPGDGFRALATYKEFQGTALTKATKSAADRQTAKYRTLYDKLEEKDRQREGEKRTAPGLGYWLWTLLPYAAVVLGVILLGWFLYWIGTSLGR